MFPVIPDNWQSLSVAELKTLRAEIRSASLEVLSKPTAEITDDERTLLATATAASDQILAHIKQAKADAAAKTALESNDPDLDDPPADDPPADDPPADDPPADDSDPALSTTPPTTTGQQALSQAPAKPAPTMLELVKASEGVPGKAPGEGFTSWGELAMAALDFADTVGSTTGKKYPIATIKGNYPANRQLGENYAQNLAMFDPVDQELTAALCAPATPYYGLACFNSLRRPTFNSMGQLAAPRMKVSIMPSPSLSDITTGVGVWSAANEASTNAVKLACQTITCGNPTDYQVYGVYRCITVRNMLAMSYPELVEAWLNRLGAAHARLAEIQLLNAMGTASTAISAPLLGYGASTTIASTLLNYLGLYQETQRWDLSANMEIWLHRWIMQALKAEIVRRRNTSGTPTRVPSDGDINALFTNAGFNPHWVMDVPTWQTAVPPVSTGGVLNRFPADVQILIAPPGKFQVMDRGNLTIGVTGDGIYRDNSSNNRNEFTIFFENFEGIVDTTNCPAHVLTIPVCWNGAQADDVLVNCQGGDEGGYQS